MSPQPTTRDMLLELADRCERVTGPDRKLDAEVAAALQLGFNLPDWALRWTAEWKPTFGGRVVLMHDDGTLGPYFSSAKFTASLDDAMILVPEGWEWGVGRKDATGKPWAWVGLPLPKKVDWEPMLPANAATPALALCAASLRARAALTPIEEQ